jgi:hypothetical protein
METVAHDLGPAISDAMTYADRAPWVPRRRRSGAVMVMLNQSGGPRAYAVYAGAHGLLELNPP